MEVGVSDSEVTRHDHFRAFVSYSHADAKFAHKLHRKLEGYRLPAGLRESQQFDISNGRLGTIFRDREDLAAAEDLSQAVRNALEASEALIVVCSPDAFTSQWVTQEIRLFRSLHPDRPILAALVRGEPEEAFPKPLSEGREPLAADLRKEGDGWRLGFLKIVAGIAAVPLDSLVQRDAARRIRRVTVVTVGALVALLAMIAMTIFAIQQRNEAQHQRAEAEGMVEYMLTDLRTRLKGVGRLDVMTDVNERAMDYYEGQSDLTGMPVESLQRRARVLQAMGEDDEKRGDLEKALAKFSEAHRVTKALWMGDPDNPERIFGHAQSEYWVGYIAWEQRKDDLTLKYWQAYRDRSGELRNAEPTHARSYLELGYSEGNLCTFYLRDDRDPPRAEKHCLNAIQFLKKAVSIEPQSVEIAQTLANRTGWLAKHYAKRFRHVEALDYREKELAIIEELLVRDPDNLDLIMRTAWALAGLAEQRSLLRGSEAAREEIGRSKTMGSSLLQTEPNSIEFLSSNLRIFVKAAEIEKRLGSSTWRASANRAAVIVAKIGELDPAELTELQQHVDRLNKVSKQ